LTAYGQKAINGYSPQLGNDMDNNEGDEPAGDLLWQQVREKYEDPAIDLKALAESLGIDRRNLIGLARRRGWKLRGAKKNKGTRATIQRFKELLQKRLGELEGHIDEIVKDVSATSSERDIRATNLLLRTLEKVLELERKDRLHRARKIKQRQKFDDADRADLRVALEGCAERKEEDLLSQSLPKSSVMNLLQDWRNWGRLHQQIPPDGTDWRSWMILGGRGAGKTRAGAEWVKAIALGLWEPFVQRAERIAIVAPTFAEARLVMIEGKSGLLAIHGEDERPLYEPSKRMLTWLNGCVAHVFSAEEPDGLRGPQFDAAWCH
jgi:hypothetical protein